MAKPKVELSVIIDEFKFETIYLPEEPVYLSKPSVSRPAFALVGFFEEFEPERIQLIGNAETKYLYSLTPEARRNQINNYLEKDPVAIVFTSNLEVWDDFIEIARIHKIPLLRSHITTSALMAALLGSLQVHLAPSITRHGVLVELYGEGILILGDSGIGKSETAIELVKRGHRLIADDAVEIVRMSSKTLVGKAPELIKYYAELRGIGIVDVKRTFGIGAVKDTQKIDMVIYLENWDPNKFYDRMGLEDEKIEILGISVPKITIPVHSGRNLSIIIEVAAMKSREKRMGYNASEEFFNKTIEQAMKGQNK
jgi:HPr kinase/phosphorylase